MSHIPADDTTLSYALFGFFDHTWNARIALRNGDSAGAKGAILALVLHEPWSTEEPVRDRVLRAQTTAIVELSDQYDALFLRAA